MSYIRAEEILPVEILAAIQQYVDGQTIYIPRRPEARQTWGSTTETRKNLTHRNLQMYQKYKSGACVKDLAQEFFLTEKSVQRIIKELSKNNPLQKKMEHASYLEEE